MVIPAFCSIVLSFQKMNHYSIVFPVCLCPARNRMALPADAAAFPEPHITDTAGGFQELHLLRRDHEKFPAARTGRQSPTCKIRKRIYDPGIFRALTIMAASAMILMVSRNRLYNNCEKNIEI